MNFLIRFLCVILRVIDALATPIYWLKSRGKKRAVPTIKDGLLKISATELAEKIRNRELSSEQICAAYIKRIKEVNPLLNAVVEERFESALQDARNVDIYLQSLSEHEELAKTKPLLGVPLTVKESCSLAGFSLCGGTVSRAGIKADQDGEVVSKLKSSGAIPLLVSNTPEICLSWESSNFVTGQTNNPYDVTRTSSGSSGGEGALLGAGASLIGIGSDVAGSIRLPAMFNCVFGHKPTARTIPIKGHFPYCTDERYADFFAIGPMTRYSKDLKLMMKVMANESLLPVLRLEDKVDLSKIRVFFMEEESKSFVSPKVQDEISQAIRQSVEYLKVRCNCEIISDFKFTELKNSCEIAGSALYSLDDIPNLLKADNQNLALELLKSVIGQSNYTFNLLFFYTLQYMFKTFVTNEGYLKKNEYLKQLFTEKLGQDGVFLYPTFTTSAFYHDSFLFKSMGVSYLMIFNSLGLPATNIPCGLDKNGLPVGIQVVAAPYQDRLCFAVAEELEKCFNGWISPN
ncbi:fatty-acid amide hydrolase 2-B-like [Tribolium madens]|uniref:fatty-acid amide hydrolase 2-B-like n=1 Tax=Tribolium madens TaxID=41895 RepID=UPI001CF757E4|nr:fatty-acid amide hydrolase 2-B-like [Tribolium madens]XP_044258767.1 fatty-acid amide hydrolase 2-B-like [Tribolium madens]